MPQRDGLSQSKQNLRLTRIFVILAFASNAAVNILLIGYFARTGGIELVGQWALLGAVMLAVMILDLGTVNALTYRIAKEGMESVAPILRRLIRLAALLGTGLVLVLAGASQVVAEVAQGVLLAASAALLQLVSSWLIAIRMGQQQQYWFNIKTIIRVVVQASAAIIALELGLPFSAIVVLGVALVSGGMAELLMAAILTFRDFSLRGAGASFGELRKLVAGFSALNIGQRAYQPLSQLLTAQLLGAASVGIFTVALRIPVVVNQALNEALRALLPGLVKLLGSNDQSVAIRLLRDSVATQLILVVPAGVVLFSHAPVIIDIWLGNTEPSIVSATRIFTAALIVTALGTPFHWAAQAGGEARFLGRIGLIALALVLTIGAGVMMATGNIVFFALIYGIGQVTRAIGAILVCSVKLNLVKPVMAKLRWLGVFAYLSFAVALNAVLTLASAGISSGAALMMVVVLNGAVMGSLALMIIKKRWI